MRRLAAFASLLLPTLALADKGITITFLHTNDLHAHVMPTSIKGKSYGGYARLATLVRKAREKDPNVVLLNAGDTFQGTLYFNTYEGLADAALLTQIGIQAGTVGNHEFDRGPGALATYSGAIGWPLVAANLDLSREPALRGKIAKYVVLQIGGQKLGIVGADTTETPNISSPGPNVDFRDVVPTVQAAVDELTAAKVNKIVVVTHIGYQEDQEMVRHLRDVDLVIGGHSHTPLGTPDVPGWAKAAGPYPTLVKDSKGVDVPIVQAYEWGKVLGRIQVEFDGKGKIKRVKEATPIVVDETVPEDPRVSAMARAFERPILAIQNAPVGETKAAIAREPVGGESVMANLMADALFEQAKASGAVVAFVNQGGVRSSFEPGKVTYGNAVAVMPFNNTLTILDVSGAELLAGLKQGLGTGGQLTPSSGSSYVAQNGQIMATIDGRPLDLMKTYRIALLTFSANGGDSLFAFRDAKGRRIDTGFLDIDAFVAYLRAHSPLDRKLEGRVRITG